MTTDLLRIAGIAWISAPGNLSESCAWMAMPDDSMAPEIHAGEFICFDPAVSPDAGDVVLLADQQGGLWVRRYRPKPGGQFEAVPLNTWHAPLDSRRDELQLLAVLVGHWRGRRARRH